MERKPITIYLDNNHKKNNLYQKKIILPKKYKGNSNSSKKIKQNVNICQDMIIKPSENKTKKISNNIEEIKIAKENHDSIRKKDNINFNKNKNKEGTNSIINKLSGNDIFDAIKRNSKNQKEMIQLNNNRFNYRNTMSPKNNIKNNMIYKKNLILLKKENSRKKNYSFDYKNKEITIQNNTSINSYNTKNKIFISNLNKNKKNLIKNHTRINSCGNISDKNININEKNYNTKEKNNIIFNNKNKKNKSFNSSYKQTKENSNTNSNITSENNNKSNIESPKTYIINNNNKVILKQENKKSTKSNDEKKNISFGHLPLKTEVNLEKNDIDEYNDKKQKDLHLINGSNIKYNFNPLINYTEKNRRISNINLDMPRFYEFESIKEEKINENDTDLKSSFYDEEEFVIINYDYTLNDKNKQLKISKVENINIDGYILRKLDFIKFIKNGIYKHAIKYVFNLFHTIYQKKIEIDKTMTDKGNDSFIHQERIEHNNTIYNKAQFDINNNE